MYIVFSLVYHLISLYSYVFFELLIFINFLHTAFSQYMYRVIQNDCQGFNNLSYTIHLR